MNYMINEASKEFTDWACRDYTFKETRFVFMGVLYPEIFIRRDDLSSIDSGYNGTIYIGKFIIKQKNK